MTGLAIGKLLKIDGLQSYLVKGNLGPKSFGIVDRTILAREFSLSGSRLARERQDDTPSWMCERALVWLESSTDHSIVAGDLVR